MNDKKEKNTNNHRYISSTNHDGKGIWGMLDRKRRFRFESYRIILFRNSCHNMYDRIKQNSFF